MKYPKGKLLLIGGAEDRVDAKVRKMAEDNKEYKSFEILSYLLPHNKANTTIELITTASGVPDETARVYEKSFDKMGYKNLNVMNIDSRQQAEDEVLLGRIGKAHAVFFSGGDQLRLTTLLGATGLMNCISEKYWEDEKFTVAGTSAGAMAIPKIMIYEGQPTEALLKNDTRTVSGVGLIDYCIVDTHFGKRGRFGRLAYSVITNPSCVGIGLGEDTALVVTKGNQMEVIGSGMVILIDGSEVRSTNVIEAEDRTPVNVEHLIVHVMSKGNGFLLKERQFLPEIKQAIKKD